jgi:MFS family permease
LSGRMPYSVWRLTLAYALMMAGTAMIVLLAGIIGTGIAPSEGLATLPVALAVVGVASSTLPTGKLLARFGRRPVFMAYGLLAISSALVVAFSIVKGSFAGFCGGAFLIGWSAAAGHQYRFAALEAVPAPLAAKATSTLLLGGLLGAFIGPELAVRGRWLLETEFSGSFVLLAVSYLAGSVIISFHSDKHVSVERHEGKGRPLSVIFRAPVVVLAVAASGLAYGVMSLIMTATPISMHQHSGHSLESTKFVIQCHIAAMYLPSLVYGNLSSWLGYRKMLWVGILVLAASLLVALAGVGFLNYWLALILLGVGWNFLFLTGTNLLPYGYQPEEKFRVQAANDFMVFTVQAMVSLSSGWLLFHWHWQGLLWGCVPLMIGFALFLPRVKL